MQSHNSIKALVLAVCATVVLIAGATAQAEAVRGPVTNLPLPRFVSMKASEGNARRGPSLNHRVDWVFRKADLPLRIVAEYGHWRRVEDHEGFGGWMHYSLLSGVRSVLVLADRTPIYDSPRTDGLVNAYAEEGVIARLIECGADWCRVRVAGYKGWLLKTSVWGVESLEILE